MFGLDFSFSTVWFWMSRNSPLSVIPRVFDMRCKLLFHACLWLEPSRTTGVCSLEGEEGSSERLSRMGQQHQQFQKKQPWNGLQQLLIACHYRMSVSRRAVAGLKRSFFSLRTTPVEPPRLGPTPWCLPVDEGFFYRSRLCLLSS